MDRMLFPVRDDVPCLTTEQMIEVDRAMIEDYGIELIQMMENAGRGLAHLSRVRFLDGSPGGKRVIVLAGTGGNGGGAMVCARRLATWGSDVCVVVTGRVTRAVTESAPEAATSAATAAGTGPDGGLSGVPAHQLQILRRMDVAVVRADGLGAVADSLTGRPVDLVIDGIIGYSLRGAPRGDAKMLIDWANDQGAPVLALDVPSGIDPTSGEVFEPAVRASATLTLALPKTGLVAGPARAHVGELYVADIGVPPELYASGSIGLHMPSLFAESEIVRLKVPASP